MKRKIILLFIYLLSLQSCGIISAISPDITGKYEIVQNAKLFENGVLVDEYKDIKKTNLVRQYNEGFSIDGYEDIDWNPIKLNSHFGKFANTHIQYIGGCKYKNKISGTAKDSEIQYSIEKTHTCGKDENRYVIEVTGTKIN